MSIIQKMKGRKLLNNKNSQNWMTPVSDLRGLPNPNEPLRKRLMPRHIIGKLQNTREKDNILEPSTGKKKKVTYNIQGNRIRMVSDFSIEKLEGRKLFFFKILWQIDF